MSEAYAKSIERAASLIQLDNLFGREIRAYGFTAYAIGYVPTSEDGPEVEEDRKPFLLLDWPREWLELYARQGFAQEDAIVARAHHATDAFTWREVQAQQPDASARIFAAAVNFGWTDGLLVPVRNGEGETSRCVGVASLAAPSLDHLTAPMRELVVAVARITFRRAQALAGRGTAILAPRERDVLALVAKGLDDAQIGVALRVSRTTAHSYVENAKRRLGAATRAQAVAAAMKAGLLP